MADRRLNSTNLITIISVTILVGTEILAAALAGAWAIGGLLELGTQVTRALVALGLLGGLWVVWKFARLAERNEPIYRPNGQKG